MQYSCSLLLYRRGWVIPQSKRSSNSRSASSGGWGRGNGVTAPAKPGVPGVENCLAWRKIDTFTTLVAMSLVTWNPWLPLGQCSRWQIHFWGIRQILVQWISTCLFVCPAWLWKTLERRERSELLWLKSHVELLKTKLKKQPIFNFRLTIGSAP